MPARLLLSVLLSFLGIQLARAESPRFQAGQKWTYKTRPGEEASTVTVLKVEGDTVHIAVDGVKLKTPKGVQSRLPHAPIAASALQGCVVKLAADRVPLPAFEEGYQQWKKANGGVFTAPVAKILDFVEEAL